jgi:hypothetical protein
MPMQAQTEGKGIAPTIRNVALEGFNPDKDLVPAVQEVGWASGPVWTGVENLAPTVIRTPDRPGRSGSLFRLRYPCRQEAPPPPPPPPKQQQQKLTIL